MNAFNKKPEYFHQIRMHLKFKMVICLICLLQINLPSYSINLPEGILNQWYITGRTGMSVLLKEITPELKALNNEFRNQPGLTLDLTISKSLGEKWEPGVNFNILKLSGNSDLPNFSATNNHYAFLNLLQLPVKYVTIVTSFSAICRYYLFNKPGKNRVYMKPYLEFGAGINYFFTELGYTSTPPDDIPRLIYYKGTQSSGPKRGNEAQANVGLGSKIVLPADIDLIISLNGDIINYDCLDAVHNYNETKRNHAFSIVPKFLLGVIIPIKKNDFSNHHMPWSP